MRCPDIDSSEVMAVKRYLAAAGWALGMLVLILDGRTAMAGAADGVEMCIKTLVPSLFPFFLLSAMLTGSLSGGSLLLTGILGGYPIGAANAARSCKAGQLTKAEAERQAVLCNCAGPSFLFGVVTPVLAELWMGFALWGIYLTSVLVLWAIFPKCTQVPGVRRHVTVQQSMVDSVRAMAGICGWVVFFRVWTAVLDRWVLWLLPDWGQAVVYGLLELSGGCLSLARIEPQLRPVLAAGFIGFGGLCVMLQTAGVADGLSLRLYFPGKLFQGTVCMLLASFLTPGTVSPAVQAILGTCAVLLGHFLRKSENRCGNRKPVRV